MTDFTLARGDTLLRSATIPSLTGPGPFNLTGCLVSWTLKHFYDFADNDLAALAALTWRDGDAPNGLTVIAPTTGVVGVRLGPEATATLRDASVYRWHLRVVDTAGEVTTVDHGTLWVTSE